jgi:hypothetical protein
MKKTMVLNVAGYIRPAGSSKVVAGAQEVNATRRAVCDWHLAESSLHHAFSHSTSIGTVCVYSTTR